MCPAIEPVVILRPALHQFWASLRAVSVCGIREFGSQFFFQSQLVVLVEVAGLYEAADLLRPLHFCVLGCLLRDLAVFGEELRVVTGEFAKRDQEIAQRDLEFVDVVVVLEEGLDEGGNLSAINVSLNSVVMCQ